MSQLKLGIQGKMHEEVTYEVSAVGIKSGGLPVYATPMKQFIFIGGFECNSHFILCATNKFIIEVA